MLKISSFGQTQKGRYIANADLLLITVPIHSMTLSPAMIKLGSNSKKSDSELETPKKNCTFTPSN